jgi:hypothetical protein
MVELENLRVSLTKNGYLKISTLVVSHPSYAILDHVSGSHAGVNLVASQVANVLCADPATGVVPGFWDEIRQHGKPTIRAFTFMAIVFSHHRLIEAFLDAGRGTAQGTILRSDFETEKEYTNLAFALSEVDASEYVRGADQVTYDLRAVTDQLQGVGDIVSRLFRAKLRRCGWRDPDEFLVGGDLSLIEECERQRFHEVLGLTARQFAGWIGVRPKKPK